MLVFTITNVRAILTHVGFSIIYTRVIIKHVNFICVYMSVILSRAFDYRVRNCIISYVLHLVTRVLLSFTYMLIAGGYAVVSRRLGCFFKC